MNMLDMVKSVHRDASLTKESILSHLLLKALEASEKGRTSIQVSPFFTNKKEDGDKIANQVKDKLIEEGFTVSVTTRDSFVYQNFQRVYHFELDW